MDPIALQFLSKEPVCVLAVVGKDGSPHAAVVHYSHAADPVRIFVQTYPTLKTEAIVAAGGSAKAAVVVGFSEEEFKSLQMHGDVRIVTDPHELEAIYKVHYAKHPSAEQYKSNTTIFLEFAPTWWRFTDFKTSPETIVEGK